MDNLIAEKIVIDYIDTHDQVRMLDIVQNTSLSINEAFRAVKRLVVFRQITLRRIQLPGFKRIIKKGRLIKSQVVIIVLERQL